MKQDSLLITANYFVHVIIFPWTKSDQIQQF